MRNVRQLATLAAGAFSLLATGGCLAQDPLDAAEEMDEVIITGGSGLPEPESVFLEVEWEPEVAAGPGTPHR